MSSPVIQTAPLEVGRSSSQSALSERPGRWNGPGGERGGVGSEARLQPRGLPAHSRRVEGRTTVPDGEPQLRAALPS